MTASTDEDARFNDLLALTSDWYWEQDEQFRYTHLSDRYYELSGLAPGDLVGTRRWDHVAVNMTGQAWARHRAQLEAHERFTNLELCFRKPEGSLRWCSVSGLPVFAPDGRFTGYRGLARDITEKKASENALESTGRRLEAAIEAGRFGIWETDLEAKQVYLSAGWSEMLGGPSTPTFTLLEELTRLSHPEDLTRLQAAQRAAIRGGAGFYECTHRVRHRDGGWRWVFSRGRITERSPEGRALRMTGTNIDVTAEMQARESLRSKEAELRTILDSVPAMIARIDSEARFVYANRNYAISVGLTPESIVGLAAAEVLGEVRAADSRPWFERALSGETVTYKRLLPDGAGRSRHFEITLSPDRDAEGVVRGCFTLVHEFTATAYAQEAIREKERELRHLLNSIPALVARVGMDERYTYANKGFAGAYRAAQEQIIGHSITELIGPALRAHLAGLLEGPVARGETVEFERELPGVDGRSRHVRAYVAPDLDGSGAVRGAYLFGIDITERKAQEKRVEALLAQVQEANKELESFAYTVSHDLRAPLRAIGGFAEILKRETAGTLDAQGAVHLRRITSNAKRMTDLIDGLLQLSRLARLPVGRRKVVPARLVAEVIADHETEIAARNVRLLIGSLTECSADPVLLKQVFANLIGNAFKYTSRHAEPEISIGTELSPEGPVYFVKDNGAGFDMDYADKLFGVFQRLHGENEFPGTGIGLATVKRIVERHGGRVWGDGKVGRGASFYFTLGA